jgi:DNA-binding transcriptional regulator YbjK
VARKNAIIDAALEVVGRAGIAGLSLRVVAAQAQIPLSAVGYYFEGKDDLIQAAFDRHIQHETARVTRAIARMGESPGAADLADRLADFVIAGLTDTRMQLLAEYEFTIEGVRRPALARASAAWQATLNAQVQAVMESLHSPSPKADARLILAVLAGLEVDQLATELQPSDARMIRDVLRRLLWTLELAWSAPHSINTAPGQVDL